MHGIRTFGEWQERLERLLKAREPGVAVRHYKYGYFSVIAFLVPFLRWLVTRRFRRELLREVARHPGARVDLVAHSFGTHLVGWALLGLPPDRRPSVHTIVLAGSVLKVGFSWRVLMDDGKVYRVINDCGVHDAVLVVNQLAVLFTGMAGRVGFNGMIDEERFLNRYFPFGHSGYFLQGGKSDDDFMRQNWVPLLTTEALPTPFDGRASRGGVVRGLTVFLLNNAEPVKLALYVAPFLVLAAVYFRLWQEARDNERKAVLMSAHLALDQGRGLCRQGDVGGGMLALAGALQLTPQGATDLERTIRTELASWQGQLPRLKDILAHQGVVTCVAFSPDGKAILTGGLDNTARLWSAATGRPLGEPLDHQGSVNAVAFSRDGESVLTASEDGKARLWEAATGQLRRVFKNGRPIRAVALSPDGRFVLTGDKVKQGEYVAGTAQQWDAATGKRIGQPLDHPSQLRVVAFSPDGRAALTGCDDPTARLWDLTAENPGAARVDFHHRGAVRAVAFSPDGKTVLTGSDDRTAGLWDAGKGGLRAGPFLHQEAVTAVAFDPNGRAVLTGSSDGAARLWDVGTGGTIGAPFRHRGAVHAVAFSPDGKTILTGGADKAARLWDAASQAVAVPLWNRGIVAAVAFSPDGKAVLTGDLEGTARLWDAGKGEVVQTLRHGPRGAHVYAVAFSPDGKAVLTGGLDDTARLWDAATGVELRQFKGHEGQVHAVAFSPDGKAVLTGSHDKKARLWEAATGNPLRDFEHRGPVLAAVFSPDGRSVLTAGSDGSAQLWDAATGGRIGNPLEHRGPVRAVAFSRDSQTVLTGSEDYTTGGEARLWEAATGRPLGPPLRLQSPVWSVALSPDRRTVLIGSDNTASLWDAGTGGSLGATFPHRDAVTAVAFSPDGQTILTGSADGTARLWGVPAPLEGDPARIMLWVQVLTGLERDDGGIRLLDGQTLRERRERLEALGGPPFP